MSFIGKGFRIRLYPNNSQSTDCEELYPRQAVAKAKFSPEELRAKRNADDERERTKKRIEELRTNGRATNGYHNPTAANTTNVSTHIADILKQYPQFENIET